MEKKLGKPCVSIIIPTYNSGGTIEECLRSVQGQIYPVCEVTVVDNCSYDDTVEKAKKFGAKTIQKKCNPAQARNMGVKGSAGKYVLFLDSDQILSSTVVDECVEKCEAGNVGMVMIPESFIGKNFWGSCSATWRNHYKGYQPSEIRSRQTIYGEPRFFSRGALTEIGGFQEALLWGEDYDLYERLKHANVREDSIKSRVYHCELSTASGILFKDLRYGKSMPIFTQHTKKQILPMMVHNVFLTFGTILRDSGTSISTVLGCAFLVCLKSFSVIIGLL